MSLLTLATVREVLWDYVDQKVTFASAGVAQLAAATGRINQVSERILGDSKFKNSLRRVTLDIHSGYITLPRELGTIHGIKLISSSGCCFNSTIYSRFHEFAHCIPCCSTGSYPISETSQTFITPTAPFTFRVKSTVTAGTISFIGGWDTNDDQIFTTDTVNITNGTANGTVTYNSMPPTGGIQKSVTTVPVELYSVTSGVETLIAVYGPAETVPSYKKYKVPDWNSEFTQALVWGKIAYAPVSADSDIVMPSNLGALKMGLKALRSEDTDEDEHGDQDWARCFAILDKEVQETDSDAEYPVFRVESGFGCEGIVNAS